MERSNVCTFLSTSHKLSSRHWIEKSSSVSGCKSANHALHHSQKKPHACTHKQSQMTEPDKHAKLVFPHPELNRWHPSCFEWTLNEIPRFFVRLYANYLVVAILHSILWLNVRPGHIDYIEPKFRFCFFSDLVFCVCVCIGVYRFTRWTSATNPCGWQCVNKPPPPPPHRNLVDFFVAA